MGDLSFPDAQSIPPSFLRRGVDFIAAEQAAGRGVLVMCAAGISRSPTFVLAYLVEKKGYDLREAFQRVRAARPIAAPARDDEARGRIREGHRETHRWQGRGDRADGREGLDTPRFPRSRSSSGAIAH